MEGSDEVIRWLLAGDPAVRWQTQRDLLAESPAVWKEERGRVATEGWGVRLVSFQGDDGRWTPRLYGHKWISTTYSLVLLRRLGLPPGHPQAVRACKLFLTEALMEDGGINVAVTRPASEVCVTGMVLGLFAWFGVAGEESLVDFLLRRQMADGGWNCEPVASHGSFHTTINVLEGLREYADASGRRRSETEQAEGRGREFLLQHRLYRSHRSGEIVDTRMLRLSFPPRWRYDVLRGLDYFRVSGADPDERLADAAAVVTGKRRADGRWPLQQRYPGRTWFEMERVGQPSRWNTLRARRVLDWWQAV